MARRLPDNPFTIDETHLDEEWLAQPALMREAGDRVADARHAAAQARARLKVALADTMLAIRDDPEKYDLPKKPTKDAVEAAAVCTAEYEKANDAVIAADHAVEIAQAWLNAIIDRRRTLQGLTDLASINYFTMEPRERASRELHDDAKRREVRGPVRGPARNRDDRDDRDERDH